MIGKFICRYTPQMMQSSKILRSCSIPLQQKRLFFLTKFVWCWCRWTIWMLKSVEWLMRTEVLKLEEGKCSKDWLKSSTCQMKACILTNSCRIWTKYGSNESYMRPLEDSNEVLLVLMERQRAYWLEYYWFWNSYHKTPKCAQEWLYINQFWSNFDKW